MAEEVSKFNFIGKILIRGELKIITGLHVGASKETVKIGGLDSPVVRDPITNLPYIPGSSLKGKMRSLSEKVLNMPLKKISNKPEIKLHVCTNVECKVCRLFGSSDKTEDGKQKHIRSRLIIRDLDLINIGDLEKIDTGLSYTEWKFENSIDRISSAANPRQIERVPAGSKFKLEIIYDAEKAEDIKEDIKRIKLAMELLELDALGGHGSRGYGKVVFEDLKYSGYPRQYYISGDKSSILENQPLDSIINSFIGVNNG